MATSPSDLATHGKTYHRFVVAIHYATLYTLTTLGFLALVFATPAGWLGGIAFAALVLLLGHAGLSRLDHLDHGSSRGEP